MTTPGWHEWCLERVTNAREYAARRGINLQIGMLHILPIYVDEMVERFPGIPLEVALHELASQAAIADHEDQKHRAKDGE
jgi:hypothetical protein